MLSKLEEHSRLLLETNQKLNELNSNMELHREALSRAHQPTYAGVTAGSREKLQPSTLHSVVVTSTDELETGEETLDRVRKAVDAKEGWIRVERIRKAKDRKIIMGFATIEEREKARQRIIEKENGLTVEEVQNKDPLVILKDILAVNTDEDVLKALKNQNRSIFQDLREGEDRVSVKYRRRGRNPHTGHVILNVSPTVWKRVTDRGYVHIDLQRVKAQDQSPLIQCSRCLDYGHTKRYCKEPADLCSHCGGPHLKDQCADWMAGVPPKCRNCVRTAQDDNEHNAFSLDCQVRQKRDRLARLSVAYC